MKVLIAKEKHSDRVFNVTTPEDEERTFLKLFKERDKEEYFKELRTMQSLIYDKAKKGNALCARKILYMRKAYEYEQFEILEVE